MISIFENEWLVCEVDDALPVLIHRWKQEPPGDEFKLNVQHVLEEFQLLKKSYANLAWLADTTLLGELDEELEFWLVSVWEDLLFKRAGVKVHAVILGPSIFADYPMEKFKLDAEEKFKEFNVHLGVFSHERDAYQWIKEQQLHS